MLTTFAAPARYVQGKDATAELGAVMRQVGLIGPALILASERLCRQMADPWKRTLGAAGIEFSVHRFGDSGRRALIGSLRDGLRMRFRFPDVTEPPVDIGLLLPKFSQAFFKFCVLALGTVVVPLLILP